MDEKILTEMLSVMKDLRDRIPATGSGFFRGPVGDPAPDWLGHIPVSPWKFNFRGPVADPATGPLLEKSSMAKLKVHQLDDLMNDLQKQIDMLKLERDLLKEQYKF
jgi:hypothetical protein